MTSEDRWTHPAQGETPTDTDRERADAEEVERLARERAVTHPQEQEGAQGLSSDSPGVDPSDRERDGGQPTFEDRAGT